MPLGLEQALSQSEQPNIGALAAEARHELTYASILNALFAPGHKQAPQQQAVFKVLYENRTEIVPAEKIIREASGTNYARQYLYEALPRVIINRLRARIKRAGLSHVLSIEAHTKLGYVLIVSSKENLAIQPHEAKDVAVLSQILKGKVHLTPNELRLFEALLKGDCMVQTNEQLSQKVWKTEPGHSPLEVNVNTLEVNVNRLKAKLDAAGLGKTYQTVNFPRIGYALYLNTPEGLARLASIRETPLHEAKNIAALTQVSMLNNIRLSPNSARYLFALQRRNGKIVGKKQLTLEVYGDTGQWEILTWSIIARLKRTIEGREINGFRYLIETHPGEGYSIQAAEAAATVLNFRA